MQQPPTPTRHQISLDTWPRRATFDLFKTFTQPYQGLCLRLDCTGTFSYAKQNHSWSSSP